MARKDVNSAQSSRDYVPQDEAEHYAQVTRLLGNGMCHVQIVMQDKSILKDVVCHIRGKFRSKNKRQNTVSVSSFVVVGMRTWESQTKNCDLLAIIATLPGQISHLFSTPDTQTLHNDILFESSISHSNFQSHTISEDVSKDQSEFDFSDI